MANKNPITTLVPAKNTIQRFLWFSIIFAATAMVLVILSVLMSIPIEVEAEGSEIVRQFTMLQTEKPSIQSLQTKIVNRNLIKPSQAKAAVKNSGAAEQLLKKLKLQGVVQLGSQKVAYIQVEKQGTQKVQAGGKLLGFDVKEVDTGKVVLSLEGVEVELTH
jgi:hypothetical protein